MAVGEIKPGLCHRNDLNAWTGMLGAFCFLFWEEGSLPVLHNCLAITRKLLVTFNAMMACFSSVFWHRKQ